METSHILKPRNNQQEGDGQKEIGTQEKQEREGEGRGQDLHTAARGTFLFLNK